LAEQECAEGYERNGSEKCEATRGGNFTEIHLWGRGGELAG
jgi:hypothetical protein